MRFHMQYHTRQPRANAQCQNKTLSKSKCRCTCMPMYAIPRLEMLQHVKKHFASSLLLLEATRAHISMAALHFHCSAENAQCVMRLFQHAMENTNFCLQVLGTRPRHLNLLHTVALIRKYAVHFIHLILKAVYALL